jgi:NAD(P) transhydrogenase
VVIGWGPAGFNFPTLTEAHKVAALDATNKLRALARLTSDASRAV